MHNCSVFFPLHRTRNSLSGGSGCIRKPCLTFNLSKCIWLHKQQTYLLSSWVQINCHQHRFHRLFRQTLSAKHPRQMSDPKWSVLPRKPIDFSRIVGSVLASQIYLPSLPILKLLLSISFLYCLLFLCRNVYVKPCIIFLLSLELFRRQMLCQPTDVNREPVLIATL